LLLTLGGSFVDFRAGELANERQIPVLFGSSPRPVEAGLIESISYPGGNLTGVQGLDTTPKAMEFLKDILPGMNKVFIPYNPDDLVSVDYLPGVKNAAAQLGVELVFQEIHSVEEGITAIENMEEDVDAIYMLPSSTLNNRNNELSRVAIKRKIPMGTGIPLDEDVLVTFCGDFFDVGMKLSRMVKDIFGGKKPADMPVETVGTKLTINLKTAEAIGIQIPEIV